LNLRKYLSFGSTSKPLPSSDGNIDSVFKAEAMAHLTGMHENHAFKRPKSCAGPAFDHSMLR